MPLRWHHVPRDISSYISRGGKHAATERQAEREGERESTCKSSWSREALRRVGTYSM